MKRIMLAKKPKARRISLLAFAGADSHVLCSVCKKEWLVKDQRMYHKGICWECRRKRNKKRGW